MPSPLLQVAASSAGGLGDFVKPGAGMRRVCRALVCGLTVRTVCAAQFCFPDRAWGTRMSQSFFARDRVVGGGQLCFASPTCCSGWSQPGFRTTEKLPDVMPQQHLHT